MDERMDLSQCRPAVQRFAVAMERKLREHDDDKGGWDDCDFEYLIDRLEDEFTELCDEMGEYESTCENQPMKAEKIRVLSKSVQDETVDVANFAMMVFDNLYMEHKENLDTTYILPGDPSENRFVKPQDRVLKRHELIDV